MEKLLHKFTKAYSTGNYSQIVSSYQKLKKYCKSKPDLKLILKENPECKQFIFECKMIQNLIALMLDSKWSPVRAQESIFIETQKQSDFFIKVQFKIDSSAISVFSILFEIDLLQTWVDTLSSSTVLSESSMYRKKIRYRYKLPWPLSNRQSILDLTCIPVPELNAVLLLLNTCQSSERSEEDINYIEMNLPCCGLWISSLEDHCEVTIYLQANQYIVMSQ